MPSATCICSSCSGEFEETSLPEPVVIDPSRGRVNSVPHSISGSPTVKRNNEYGETVITAYSFRRSRLAPGPR